MTNDSLSQSMDKTVKHYSSLFKLPSYKKVFSLLALTCMSGGILSALVLFPSLAGLVNGFVLGASLLSVNIIVDYVLAMLVLRGNPIYDLRRTAALSLYCWFFWLFFIFIGAALASSFGFVWWIRLCLLGSSAVLILRLIVFASTSLISYERLLAVSYLQPLSCIIVFLAFWAKMDYSILLFLIFSLAIGIVSSFSFISVLNRVGKQMLGFPAISLFKAFLLNWVVDLNAPFEEFLEKLGENRDVEVSLIKFGASKPKVVIVVPSVHPGPFKNVGSSLLPSMIKTALEKEFNCVACVPHGLLGHEFDLASQAQSQKVVNQVVKLANIQVSEAKATPFIKVSNGLATACCQVFDNFAFLSFTLAPKTTEDLPQELGWFVRKEAESRGLACCVVVNAHNSINETTNVQKVLGALETVAAECLKKAASLGRSPFEISAATVTPKEYSLKEGMGPGGITVVVVKVEEQKTAYVVIDGNNMVSGLRENIISALQSIGIDECEVFTTDTHSVSAVILNDRGYHPVGEVIDHEKLTKYIEEATLAAVSSLEPVKATCQSMTISDVKVIGEKQLETLCLLIDKTIQQAKKAAAPIFATSGLLLMLILMFI